MAVTAPPKARPKLAKDSKATTPIRASHQTVLDSGDSQNYQHRLLVGTPSRGTVRIEWHAAIRGLMIPANWGMMTRYEQINEYFPTRFTVPDAQNLIVRQAVEQNFEWLVFIEDDVLPPVDLFVRFDEYMSKGPAVVSGLYYQKSNPCEPLVYRGRGDGAYLNWQHGDKVWCDGVPTGCLLIHCSILREMWADSPEYEVAGQVTRQVFDSPSKMWVNPEGDVNTICGTSDLIWCQRVIDGGYLKKAGWTDLARKKFPFLLDTNIFCQHITPDGRTFPPI
jgi:hypothetical protein